MADWKEMYLTLMRETERAVRILTEAQNICEELYLTDEPPALVPLFPKNSRTSPKPPECGKNSDFLSKIS